MPQESSSENLKVAVVGAGRMGADHIRRLQNVTQGAEVAAVIDINQEGAQRAANAAGAAGAVIAGELADVLADVDAVLLATPGSLHESSLIQVLQADKPVLCEKPLTVDSASAWRVVQAETALGKQRIQVGFMRQFDAGYQALRQEILDQEHGQLLMLHCVHRNPGIPEGFTEQMLINDSVVHEFDGIRFLTGEEIRTVQVRSGKASSQAPFPDPQQVLISTDSGILADVEIFVTAQFGYQVATSAVFERQVRSYGYAEITPGFVERFEAAYDAEVQAWVDATRRALATGVAEIAGPSAWDGYATAACCEAGVSAQQSGDIVSVNLEDKPSLYNI